MTPRLKWLKMNQELHSYSTKNGTISGYWVAEVPTLLGCISQGKTREEAVNNIKEAIKGYVAALEEDHLHIPDERFDALVVAV